MILVDIKPLEFELAYLASLTYKGLKPLSRWETELSEPDEEILRKLGLKTRKVLRLTTSGKPLSEHVFSLSEKCTEEYLKHFDGKKIDSSPRSMWIEGKLFGYPSCCIRNFIKYGYRKNYVGESVQRILFHWVCPNCRITPIIVPQYRKVYEECLRIFRTDNQLTQTKKPTLVKSKKLKRMLATTASVTALLFIGNINAVSQDAHLLPIKEDTDNDYLKDNEENILKTNPLNPDEDGNKINDGIDLATVLYNIIVSLPNTETNNQVYAIPHLAYGLETCDICGESVNMGNLEIINPLENQSISIPFISLHYLEHGGFSYSGSVHTGRINPPLLKTICNSIGFAHFLNRSNYTDNDLDGLDDYEEEPFSLNPQNPDSNSNGIVDGIELARNLLQQVKNLPRAASIETGPKDQPFVIEHPMDGYEICPVCGEPVTMDYWLVHNPTNKLSITIPSMALHYLEHGGFCWEGGNLFNGLGRIYPLQLKAVLEGIGDGHILPAPNDNDCDGICDIEESLFGFLPTTADTDNDGIKDGCSLTKTFLNIINNLPRTETNGIYVIEHQLRGIVYCPVCGESINMGYIEIINKPRNSILQLDYLTIHFLEHSSFANTVNKYISPIELSSIFKSAITYVSNPQGIVLKWQGESGKHYTVFISDNINGAWEKYREFIGNDEEIQLNINETGTTKFFKITIR